MKVRLTKIEAMRAIEEAANLNFLKTGAFYEDEGCTICAAGAIASKVIESSNLSNYSLFETTTNIGKGYTGAYHPLESKYDREDTDLAKISAAFEYAGDKIEYGVDLGHELTEEEEQYKIDIASTHAMFEIMYLEGTHVNFEDTRREG